MLYKCDHCSYTTKRRCDLIRHENRKTFCYKKIEVPVCILEDTKKHMALPEIVNATPEIINATPEIINAAPEIINAAPEIINATPEIINATPEIINATPEIENNKSHICPKCNKGFSRKDHIKEHLKKCEGFDKKQCKICLRMFTTAQGKYQHTKYVKCNPPVASAGPSTINNTYNTTNNYNNTINLDIRGNFDKITKEDIQNIVKQLEQSDYIKMIQNNMSKGKYAIPRTIEHLYFNDDHPTMQTLKKERRNDKMVEVHVDGKWEKRLIDDIMKKLVSKVEDYHSEYFKYLEDKYKNIPIGSKEWNQAVRPIKTFGHMMLWYNGFSGSEIENIGIPLNSPDDDKEKKAKNKDMAKIVKEKIYEFTPKSSIVQ